MIVNTGVSTLGPVQIAVRDLLSRRCVAVPVADIRRLGRASASLLQQKLGSHGDEHETSLMLAIASHLVDMGKARTDCGNMLGWGAPPSSVAQRCGRGPHHSGTGVRGNPTLTTAEKRAAIVDDIVAELIEGLRSLCT